MAPEKKKKMTREQAMELYDDLQRTMVQILNNTSGPDPKKAKAPQPQRPPVPEGPAAHVNLSSTRRRRDLGQIYALGAMAFLAMVKIAIGGIEVAGVGKVPIAQAAVLQPLRPIVEEKFNKQEIELLKKLDTRRAELEQRKRSLDERAQDLDRRDREFAARLTQLRELTGKLQGEREQNNKKKSTQIEQLANVYGAMNPPEAAALLEQLDVTTALALIEKMPEKRIGQILALMSAERALMLTKMISGKGGVS